MLIPFWSLPEALNVVRMKDVTGFLLLELAIDLCLQLVGDVGDVTATLTQRRQGGREVEEVFSNRPGRDGFVEVAIGGGEHADGWACSATARWPKLRRPLQCLE